MSTFTQNFREKISGMSPRDLIYPSIGLVFFIIVFILFFLSTSFLGKSINSAFLEDVAPDTSTLNIDNYSLVAKKLGVNTERRQQTTETAEENPAENLSVDEDVTEAIEKSSLSFRVLNASGKSGAAGALASKLEAAGFTKATVGNQSKSIPVTTIVIKERALLFESAILEEVVKTYPDATTATTTEDARYDVLITIGGK